MKEIKPTVHKHDVGRMAAQCFDKIAEQGGGAVVTTRGDYTVIVSRNAPEDVMLISEAVYERIPKEVLYNAIKGL